jgi:hypothetical protein
MHELIKVISEAAKIDIDKIIGKERFRPYMIPRQLLCYYLRKKYFMTLEAIGNVIGKHHSSVIHSIAVIENMISIKDTETISLMALIDQQLSINNPKQPEKIVITIPCGVDAFDIYDFLTDNLVNCKIEIVF